MTDAASLASHDPVVKRLPVVKRQDSLPWMIPEYCEACADCVSACPVFGLEMWETEDSDYSIPWLANPDVCIGCAKCEEVCTWGAISMTSFVAGARERLFTKRPYRLSKELASREYCLHSNVNEKVVVVACIDCELSLDGVLREKRDNCYVLRNAGNMISDCVIRSLVLAIDVLGAKEIILIGHSKCELRHTKTKELREVLASRVGDKSLNVLGKPFNKWLQIAVDPVFHLKAQEEMLRKSELIPGGIKITGLIYDEYNEKLVRVFGPESHP
ncbi:MAG: 4Fe-4S dicluster domain-containing protein [Gallionella sp.]|nr:4Fe-4S dicluster domain-containing protein [Gallionella sp.]